MNLNLRKILAWIIDLTMVGLFVAAIILALSSCSSTFAGLPFRPMKFPVAVVLIENNSNDSGYRYGYGLIDRKRDFYYHSCNVPLKLDSVFLNHEALMKTKDFKLLTDK